MTTRVEDLEVWGSLAVEGPTNYQEVDVVNVEATGEVKGQTLVATANLNVPVINNLGGALTIGTAGSTNTIPGNLNVPVINNLGGALTIGTAGSTTTIPGTLILATPVSPVWISLSVSNSAGTYTGTTIYGAVPSVKYYKDALRVYLAGGFSPTVNGGTPGQILATLPVGYRPTSIQWTSASSANVAGASGSWVISIATTGVIRQVGGLANGLLSLDGCSFPLF